MPNQLLKQFFRITYLHHIAAYLQEIRRNILRSLGLGSKVFEINSQIRFKIDIAARSPFSMFTLKDADMIREMSAFIQLARDKKCFLDIGSHYGIYSLSFASINPDGQAYAIEPSPKCFSILERNRDLNPEMKIAVENVALGKEKGEVMMHYEWVHLIGDHSESDKGKPIKVFSLDQLISDKSISPDIIKLDVDGFEGPVIDGALNFLSSHDPLIFLELHGQWIGRYGYTAMQIHNTLENLGYKFFDLDLKPIMDIEKAFNLFANRIICRKV